MRRKTIGHRNSKLIIINIQTLKMKYVTILLTFSIVLTSCGPLLLQFVDQCEIGMTEQEFKAKKLWGVKKVVESSVNKKVYLVEGQDEYRYFYFNADRILFQIDRGQPDRTPTIDVNVYRRN